MFLKEVSFESVRVTHPGLCVVKLCSSQAKQWLSINRGNRSVRRTLVEYLKKQIAAGEWQDNHPQPIVFSDLGRLIDGQHRLHAIAEADIANGHSVRVRVETGAPDAVREYLDTGITRTLADRVALHDNPAWNKLITQIVTVDQFVRSQHSKSGKATPDEARAFYELHKDALLQVCSMHKRERGTGMIPVCLAAMQHMERDWEKAIQFYDDLFKPAGEVQQAQMLRDFLLRVTSAGGSLLRKESHLKAIACMKAFSEDRVVKKVVPGNW